MLCITYAQSAHCSTGLNAWVEAERGCGEFTIIQQLHTL